MTGSSFYSVEKVPGGSSGGTTQAETRIYNERLIISLIRRHGQLSKAELTRLTGLSPQTMTTIVNRLADNQILLRCDPLRGRLGQPSVPYALNPGGAYSFGLKIDHRSADLVLVNLVGEVIATDRIEFPHPTPDKVMAFARSSIARISRKHKAATAERIAGLGIASPFHHRGWDESDVAFGQVAAWKEVDVRAELDEVFDWPVYLLNDATVGAAAELMFGSGSSCADFLYAYVGYFIGGGLVLDHHLYPGRNKLAAAIGDIPVPAMGSRNLRAVPLAQVASLQALARKLKGTDHGTLFSSPQSWPELGGVLDEWVEEVADGLAHATQGAVALLDVDNLVIDGAMPVDVRKAIARATRRHLARAFDRPEPFSVIEGAFGYLGPAIGGASIPLLVKFSNDKELLFKD